MGYEPDIIFVGGQRFLCGRLDAGGEATRESRVMSLSVCLCRFSTWVIQSGKSGTWPD